MHPRLEPFLTLCLACALPACGSDGTTTTSSSSTGGAASAGGGAFGGAGGAATGGGGEGGAGGGDPMPVTLARCGLTFAWLDPTTMGTVVTDDTPHSTLTILEAFAAKAIVQNQGFDFDRSPQYETLAHRIVYTTQDRGQPREATALVVVPQVDQPETFPVLLFHHGTTGMTDACAPTYQFEDTQSEGFLVGLLMSLFSAAGYIVVAPDYLGQKSLGAPSPELHPYLIGEPTAVAAWDSVRAAKSLLASDGSSAEAGPVALWGASQGGHAALFSALYQPFYAPEIDLRTGVYGIPPSDLEAHMTLGTRELRSSTGNVVLFYTAAQTWYQPSLAPGLGQIFVSPYDAQIPAALATSCSPTLLDGASAVEEVFTSPLLAASQSDTLTGYEPWGCFARENSATRTSLPVPTIPGLVVLGENDTLVDPTIERAAFTTLCGQGHKLSYLECAGAGHTQGFVWAIDDMLDFIDARLAGQPVIGECTQSPAQTCSNTP